MSERPAIVACVEGLERTILREPLQTNRVRSSSADSRAIATQLPAVCFAHSSADPHGDSGRKDTLVCQPTRAGGVV